MEDAKRTALRDAYTHLKDITAARHAAGKEYDQLREDERGAQEEFRHACYEAADRHHQSPVAEVAPVLVREGLTTQAAVLTRVFGDEVDHETFVQVMGWGA